jgi:hypothetical protein
MMNLQKSIGLPSAPLRDAELLQYINLKLAFLGLPTANVAGNSQLSGMLAALLSHEQETGRLLTDYLPPVDRRIQAFLDDYLCESGAPKLPGRTFVLDQYGLARALSLPPDGMSSSPTSSVPIVSSKACCTTQKATGAPRRAFFM